MGAARLHMSANKLPSLAVSNLLQPPASADPLTAQHDIFDPSKSTGHRWERAPHRPPPVQGSHFAESNQKIIELKEDKPDALEAVIRYLYFGACVAPEAEKKKPWSFFAEVSRTADKYLLRDLAHDAMTTSILKIRDIFGITQICDVALEIKRDFMDEEELRDELWQMQEEYFDEFLLEPKFVAAMSEKEVREQFNRLRLTFCGARERSGHICGKCGRIFDRPGCKITHCEGSTKPTTYWLPRPEQKK